MYYFCLFVSGKRARQQLINPTHQPGDGQVVTNALNLQIPNTMEDFCDELDEAKYQKMNQAILDSKQATRVLNLFLDELTIIVDVEVIIIQLICYGKL